MSKYYDSKASGNATKSTDGAFQVILAYNSLQLLGLGRMGEGLHPWADLVLMAKAWCLGTPDAKIMVVAPAAEKDLVVFNSRR